MSKENQPQEQQTAKTVSLADQIRLEKQIRADHCIAELDKAMKEISEKYNCKIVVEMVISERGNFPQVTVVPNDPV